MIIYTFGSYYYYKLKYDHIHGDTKNNDGVLVFINGWPDTSLIWTEQVNYLSSNNNYCCITLELMQLMQY